MAPRRYPRISTTDPYGDPVTIPVSIAPKLLANEKFTSSLTQNKIFAVTKAITRVEEFNQNLDAECVARQGANKKGHLPTRDNEISSRRARRVSPGRETRNSSRHGTPSSSAQTSQRLESSNRTTSTASAKSSIENNVASSVKTQGSSSSHFTRSRSNRAEVAAVRCRPSNQTTEAPGTGAGAPNRRRKKTIVYWTPEEDDILLSAVVANWGAARAAKKLPRRTSGAVKQRYRMVEKKHEKTLAETDSSDSSSLIYDSKAIPSKRRH